MESIIVENHAGRFELLCRQDSRLAGVVGGVVGLLLGMMVVVFIQWWMGSRFEFVRSSSVTFGSLGQEAARQDPLSYKE